MHSPGGFGELGFEQASLKLEAALRMVLPSPPRRLTRAELDHAYFRRGFARGWRIDILFEDGITRAIDLLIGSYFPAGYPRTALVDGPGQLVWPHVEYDGVLCLLPVMAEVDAEDPGAVAVHLIARSTRLIEELLEGSIIDRDFREEFLTYWAYAADGRDAVQSLIDPAGPSRKLRVWRDGKGLVIIGEDKASLERWLTKRFGKRPGRKSFETEPAVLLWLPEPPVPAEYPSIGADLIALADRAGEGAADLLKDVVGTKDVTVLIGATGRGGPGLVAAATTAARRSPSRQGRVEMPLTQGFDPRAMAKDVAALRTYSVAPLVKSNVERADRMWVHGRGKDPRTPVLLGKTITLIGCGSVNSSVAARLARAGVGTIHIVDPNNLKWSNVGRHELGAGSVGLPKATELANRLQRDFPHLDIFGHVVGAQRLIDGYSDLLSASDLIVAATGSWDAEGAFNRWHIANDRRIPIVYGWTESLAAAGHAVTIRGQGGCLRCGIGPTGIPAFAATEWPEGGATVEEPACGNHFHPYGSVELGFVVDLIATAALQALLSPSGASLHDLWLGSSETLSTANGRWTAGLLSLITPGAGGQKLSRVWPDQGCAACVEALLAQIAAE